MEVGSVNSDDMSAKYFPEPAGLPSVVSKKYTFVSFPPSRTGHVLIRDWSKSIGGGGPEHLEMWLIKNT